MDDLGEFDLTPRRPDAPPRREELSPPLRLAVWLGLMPDPEDWPEGEPWTGYRWYEPVLPLLLVVPLGWGLGAALSALARRLTS